MTSLKVKDPKYLNKYNNQTYCKSCKILLETLQLGCSDIFTVFYGKHHWRFPTLEAISVCLFLDFGAI